MSTIGWIDTEADAEQLAELWPDGSQLGEATYAQILTSAYEGCRAYAPALPAAATVPEGWRTAQIMQAAELWAASRRDGDVIGFSDTVAIRARPLGATVKSLLRPRPGVPRLG
jgi:hypothetical protein